MIWVTWRQQRVKIISTFGVVLGLGVLLFVIRQDVLSLGDLDAISQRYNQFLVYFPYAMLALPVLVGIFVGAPLVAAEIEHGTHVFGLTQSVGRMRWWAVKLLVGGLPVVLAMFALGLLAAWALRPLNFVMGGPLNSPLFEVQGPVLGGYSALAFVLGVIGGLVLRNTLGAMVLTLVVYVAVLVAVGTGLRPSYAEPMYTVQSGDVATPASKVRGIRADAMPMHAWRIDLGYLDEHGNPTDFRPAPCGPQRCEEAAGISGAYALWHPVERFWRFQLTETGLMLLLSAALLGVGSLTLRRRLS